MIFYSHATDKRGTKLLKDHLREVGVIIEKTTPRTEVLSLSKIGYLIGVAHDFGKYTTFFQDYLISEKEDPSRRHQHSFISALFTAYLLEGVKDKVPYIELIGYFVVLHHHGDMNALELALISPKKMGQREPWRSRLERMYAQIEDIRKNLSSIALEYKELIDIGIEDFLDRWKDTFSRLDRASYWLLEKEDEEIRLKTFVFTNLLYSLLIDADKREAAYVKETKRKGIPEDLVDRYRESSPKINTMVDSGIDGIRNEIYKKVIQKITEIPLDNHIFTLTAPTGSGKTLTSLSCALKLRERIKKEKGYIPRIIYSLPFISITEQNYEVIREVFEQLDDFEKDESSYLIKHHHLAEVRYKAEDRERPVDESLLLIESWDSEVIITTFIQLLHSIIGFKNRFLKKYHNIAGSIILLDEVQNIPVEYWPLVNKTLKLLARHLHSYIILLTATKPLIFEEEEAIELLDENMRYFEGLDRITLIPNTKGIEIAELFSWFKSIYDKEKSYLVVLNTINSSIRFYNMVKEDEKFTNHKRFFHLSTNIIPKERAFRINKIKELLDRRERIIVVSTQVVEAGIDIDLECAIRDLGPIDSIVQVAGRCNRAMKKEKGEVYIFSLKENHKDLSKLIYGAVHTALSKELLDTEPIRESQFFGLINRYFSLVSSKKDQTPSALIWDAIKRFRFHHPDLEERSISYFSLIEERGGYIDIFIERDEEAKEVWRRYEKGVRGEKDFKKKKENYLLLKKEFTSYIISIPRKMAVGIEVIDEWLGYIPHNRVSQEYEEETGFKRIEEGTVIF